MHSPGSTERNGFRGEPHRGAVHSVQTWLRDEKGGAVLSTCNGPTLRASTAGVGAPLHWNADSLLVAAVEVGVRADFLHRAGLAGLGIAFYESTALGRWAEGADGPDLLDLFIEPRVGVRCAADATLAGALFTEVATRSLVARSLRAPLRLQPTVEVWAARSGHLGEPVPS
jgi:hypothetical protein